MTIVMVVLGAVVMPHNQFLHSEIIQSRKWNHEDDRVIRRQLFYEFLDTSFSMLLSIQLPITVIAQIRLTAFAKVMGKYRNSWLTNASLILVAAVITVLNVLLFISFVR